MTASSAPASQTIKGRASFHCPTDEPRSKFGRAKYQLFRRTLRTLTRIVGLDTAKFDDEWQRIWSLTRAEEVVEQQRVDQALDVLRGLLK